MKQVSGFQANDGTFYEDAERARVHDAQEALLEMVNIESDGDAFLEVVDKYLDLVKEYVDAKSEANQVQANKASQSDQYAGTVSTDIDPADNAAGEEGLESFLSQQIGRLEQVPHVGSSPRAEEVQHRSAEHGTGSGKGTARRVRRMSVVASPTPPEDGETR